MQKTRSFCLTLISIFSLTSVVLSQDIDTPYQFPIRPGTPEWAKVPSTHKAHCEVTCIPEDQLHRMTTRALALTYLDYPMFIVVFAHNTLQDGFNAIRRCFNGLDELIRRPDCGSVLLSMYQQLKIGEYDTTWSEERKVMFATSVSRYEILLSQEDVLQGMTPVQRIELLRQARTNAEVKVQCCGVYSRGHFGHGVLLAARIMSMQGDAEFKKAIDTDSDLKRFVKEGGGLDAEQLFVIIQFADEFLLKTK